MRRTVQAQSSLRPRAVRHSGKPDYRMREKEVGRSVGLERLYVMPTPKYNRWVMVSFENSIQYHAFDAMGFPHSGQTPLTLPCNAYPHS